MHVHHHGAKSGAVLVWSLVATAAFVALEVWAGFRAGSLALLSDAGHNATDALALLLAWVAVYVQKMPPDESRTFGYHRAGVLAAFLNALALVALSCWLAVESWMRLMHPAAVNDRIMFWVAVAAVILNGGVMLGIERSGDKSVNMRAAYVHMLGDLLGAIAIIVGAVVIRFTGWTAADPLLSLAIAALIVWSAIGVIRESLNILLEGSPRGMETADVTAAIRGVAGVLDVHDLHIWSIGSDSHALSSHVLIEDMPPSQSGSILHRINHVLADRFHIHHTTVQFEHAGCEISDTGCSIGSHEHFHDHGHDHGHHHGHSHAH